MFLFQFGVIHADPLRDSGIGKALMYLYKHPRETKENKIKLIKIIRKFFEGIFDSNKLGFQMIGLDQFLIWIQIINIYHEKNDNNVMLIKRHLNDKHR